VVEPAGFADALSAAVAAGDVAAVLLRLAAADDRSLINCAKALAPAVQGMGAALLIGDHAQIVARVGADGAHLSGIEALNGALGALKPARIAGCGALMTRHDAMLAAEAGADYVMFGGPDDEDRPGGFDTVIERVEWWAEVFETPCVGYAASADEVAPLVAAGADFVALGAWAFAAADGPAAAIAQAAQQLARTETVG
jgi:thiamine-phosphate pyrophosphorylase